MITTELRATPRAQAPEDVPLAWGDRLLPEAPALNRGRHSAKAAAGQVGYGVDLLGSVPLSSSAGLLVAAHAHRADDLPDFAVTDARERTKISMAAHGLSVAAVRRRRRSGEWELLDPTRSRFHRRVHGSTLVKLTGPAAGDPRLRTPADPGGRHVRGTFGHSVGTLTPWGSFLSAEGGFADYFDASGPVEPALVRSFGRYRLDGQGRGWADIDARFDLARTPQEAFRFGWVVLLDPRRPSARPRKLTMLGRLGHGRLDASIADDGRAVIRLSDGLPGGHDYVYVSQWPVDHGPLAGVHNRRLLTTGTLYVVPPGAPRPDDPDAWVPLVTDSTSYVPGLSVASALLDTRLAAQRLLGEQA